MFIKQKDLRAEPIRRMVAMGDSCTWGCSASSKNKSWFGRLAAMISEFQGSPVEAINKGISGNVITSECPNFSPTGSPPSGLDRLARDAIALKPDLLLISYGLNDSRAGTPPEVFRQAFQEMIDRTRAEIRPVIVALNLYYMHEYMYKNCEGWNRSDYNVAQIYNLLIRQLAEDNGLIYADIFSAQSGADWFVDEDHCHPNDLGHFIIANKVFEAIARNCSFTAATMPGSTLLYEFDKKYGGGPEKNK